VTGLDLQPYVDTGSGRLPPWVGVLDPKGPLSGVAGKSGGFDMAAYVAALRACFADNRIAATSDGGKGLVPVAGSDEARVTACYIRAKAEGVTPGGAGVSTAALLYVDTSVPPSIPWWPVAAIGILVVGAAGLLTLPLSRRLTRPLSDLSAAAEAIRAGDLEARVEQDAPTEVAALAVSFNAMAAQLDLADEGRKQFTADVAHELRSPVTNIRNHLDAMEDGILPVDETELATLSREADRLTRLIDDLQTMSALDSAAVRLETTTIDVVPLIAHVIEARRGRAAARDVAVTTDGDPSALATVDPGRLAQVVGNLLDNAMEHAGAGRVTVEVVAGEAGGPVIIRVTDDGPGLDEVASKRAFDRMWRGDPARSGGGQGLGLPIARGLARAMGGDVSVAHAPTGGACFVVAVPAGANPAR